MSKKNHQKGRALENAVSFIQQTILDSDPELKGTKFSIELNKIVAVAGVRHEIDIFIKTLPGSRYESLWIFECKNWAEPVGKNEVIILAKKVEAVGANRGFLVARKFSQDAKAQAKQDTRLGLVHCSDEFLSPFNNSELVHTVHVPGKVTISLRQRGVTPDGQGKPLVWADKLCILNGQPVNFTAFVLKQVDRMIAEDQKENATKYRLEGEHAGQRQTRVDFDSKEFVLGEMDVEWLVDSVVYTVTVRKKKLLSKFEVEGQGRAFSFEPIEDIVPGKQLKIDVVERF